ncbi:pyrroloquinoline quinone biosynthesis protein PqqB [Streptomyces sp. NPDC050161]|uniref:pyrroloquinoline quinone biosynthesis protein PqqB n=1 Tax=Streptomyces sp. NPDC050161 TaxID=3365604 RepID=UPI0037B7357E
MLLKVLGTAAGGGVPQWNCACPGCAGARAHPERRRRHASLAVRADEGQWFLINATPDIADQIEATPQLHPGPAARRTPVRGLILTDAELDHTLGLARLREADRVDVLATAPVRRALCERLHLADVLGPYTDLTWRELGPDPLPLTDTGTGIEISALPVSAKRPRYAAGPPVADADDPTWVIALRLHDPATGGTAVYAPCLSTWPPGLDAALADADCVLLDGTFWDDDEPHRSGFSTRSATAMGHLPIDGPHGTAHRLAPLRARCLYTHLNNTNPLTDPGAPQHGHLAARGLAVAVEGMEIAL